MAWLAVDKDGSECIFHNKPVRTELKCWEDREYYSEYRGYTTNANDGSIELSKGTIKKLIGRELTWNDEPVKLE